MKTLIVLFLSTMSLCAATSYPLLTDNPARTVSGGGTNIAGLTNANTFTGVNTFPPSLISANNIGVRELWSSPTNIFIPLMGVVPQWTNNGTYSTASNRFSITIPPLLGSNSHIVIVGMRTQTNINTVANGQIAVYIGSNTNYIGSQQAFTTANNSSASIFGMNAPLLASAASWTNQLANNGNFSAYPLITNYCDTSVSNTIYFGFFSTSGSSRTNDIIVGMAVYEVYRP